MEHDQTEKQWVWFVGPQQCPAEMLFDRKAGRVPARCVLDLGHQGDHLADAGVDA